MVKFGFEDLDVWRRAVGWINDKQLEEAKSFGSEIGKMLTNLIKSIKSSIK